MIGTQLGPYRIRSDLGSGGMGKVYLAEAVETAAGLEPGTKVALKVVHPHLLETPGFFKRFLQEADLGQRVRHKNVVRTFDVDAILHEGQHHHYMVMEHVEGKNLRELLVDLGTIPETLLREIAVQSVAGLAAIHEQGIVHRDLKPENILITDDHEIRIMDLGVAKLQEATLALTKEGQFAGSLPYAAPEQFRRHDEVGPAADLYSLGVLLYELAMGQNPFRGDDAAGVIQAHLNETPPPVRERDENLSLFFSEVIATLLAKQASDRFESAETLHAILEQGERSAWWVERAPVLHQQEARLPRIRVSRETKLHGRAGDLQVLREAWDRAKAGDGNTVFLEGEAGIGKTRLLDAFLRGVQNDDLHVLYGSYPPSGGMGGFSDAILGKFGEARLADALAPYLTTTPSLVPTFAALLQHESAPTGAEPFGGDALQAVVVQLMRGLAAEKPTVWILDDLQFAPQASHDLLLAMARGVEDHRVLLVATARPGPALEEFSRLGNFRRVALGRLGAREIIDLLEDAFKSEDLAEKLGGKIAKKSDGVPFFIFEMIRGLKEGQFITEQPDGTFVQTQVIDEIEVPSAVKDLIEGRMRGLTEDQRAILDAGAVQGMTFEPALVAHVLEEKKIRVLRQIAEIERRFGLVRGEATTCHFDQNQIQEVLYKDLLPELRSEYHTLLAEAHAERCGDEPEGDDAVFLVHHHLRGSQPRLARPHLRQAFDHLTRGYRDETLLGLVMRALNADGLLEGGERAEVLLRRAQCLDLLGRRDEQRAALDEALPLADGTDDARLRSEARRSLGAFLYALSEHDAAQTAFQESLELARAAGDKELEVGATVALGRICFAIGRPADGQEQLERSLALSREMGFRSGEASAAGNLGNVFYGLGRYAEAQEHYERFLALSSELGDRRNEAIAAGNLGAIYGNAGRYAKALECFERNRELSREIGYRPGEALATECLGGVSRRLGRLDESRAHHERVRGLCRETGDRRIEGYALQSLGAVAENEGELDMATRCYGEALVLRRAIGYRVGVAETLGCLGGLSAAGGRMDVAVAQLDEAIELARETRNPGTILGAIVARARLPDGDVEAALAALVEHEEHLEHAGKMDARFRLWELTQDRAHLDEAHRLLAFMRDHAPEDCRESMIENVPLHRDIAKAWEEHGTG